MKKYIRPLFLMWAILVTTAAYAAPTSDEEDLALAYGDKSFVSIASGSPQLIARAPSVATVITAEDIAAIGAADLDEVLETVPGLHVGRSPLGYNPIYIIRGIATQYNPQVLMLVNGIPITGVTVGDRSNIWGGMPIENIARIEVIRGPGSALYGADAFSGVINIITKTSSDLNSTDSGVRLGAFNSYDAWVQHGGKWAGLDTVFYLRAGHTDGQRKIITTDAMTGTSNPSLAPGPVNLERNAVDARLDLARNKWRLRAGYQQREVGTGAGVASALDPKGINHGTRTSADLTYQDVSFAPDWDMTAQASYLRITEKSDLVLYPAGFDPPGPAGPYPDGFIGNPDKWEHHLRFVLSAAYSGFEKHKLRFGTGTQGDNLYRTEETNNFAGGNVVEATPFLLPHKRRLNYAYAQDEWAFTQDWYLTAGIRHDHYSDFGYTTNPRLALVWETAYNLTSKLLYGRAFRPPSFSELYNRNNPVLTGNPYLKPEKIESIELAFVWQAASDLQANLNLFRYQMRDILRPDTGTVVQNSGKQNGQGMEIELVWDANPSWRMSGNYAYQRSIDAATNRVAGNAPRHHMYARSDWRFMPGWTFNTQLNYIADRKREPSDTRPDIADYHTVDISFRNQKRSSDWDFAFLVRNLLDADAREPSPSPGLIANDLPLTPREWRVEVRRKI